MIIIKIAYDHYEPVGFRWGHKEWYHRFWMFDILRVYKSIKYVRIKLFGYVCFIKWLS